MPTEINYFGVPFNEICNYYRMRDWLLFVYPGAWDFVRMFFGLAWRECDGPSGARLSLVIAASIAWQLAFHFGSGLRYRKALHRYCRARWGIDYIPCNIIFQLPG